ncbi:MAG: GNAT family N-acetyltransferase, partial [Candidatus Eisenbacteria bacterium]
PAMPALHAAGLRLEPLTVAHADEMFALLSDASLYEFMDGEPPVSLDALRELYARLESRRSPDGGQRWLNWIVRAPDGRAIGFVQATVCEPVGDAAPAGASGGPCSAWIAYVIASGERGRGHATAATAAMIQHLHAAHAVGPLLARVEAANEHSVRLLERLGFRPATSAEVQAHDLAESERLYVRDDASGADARTVPARVRPFWEAFLATQPAGTAARFREAFYFADSEHVADELARLVLAGRKRATASLLWVHEAEGSAPPAVGSLSVMTDFAGTPLAVLAVTASNVVPFEDVGPEFAAREGEGDGSLEYWRRVHWAYFSRECASLRREPDPRMAIVCEEFALVYPPEAADRT